jgi:TRAP-type C4-dicarboxylate transport system permease small subunit
MRVVLVTLIITLLSFAVSLLLGICAVVIAAKLHGVHPDLRIAYRYIALPVAAVVGAIMLVTSALMELRHYRRARTLSHIERQIGRAS